MEADFSRRTRSTEGAKDKSISATPAILEAVSGSFSARIPYKKGISNPPTSMYKVTVERLPRFMASTEHTPLPMLNSENKKA